MSLDQENYEKNVESPDVIKIEDPEIKKTNNIIQTPIGKDVDERQDSNFEEERKAYLEIKEKLISNIVKKKETIESLQQIQQDIFKKESDYYNSSVYGNVVKGFDAFTKVYGSTGSNKKKLVHKNSDYIFSLGSVEFLKSWNKKKGIFPETSRCDGDSTSLSSFAISPNMMTMIDVDDSFEDYEDSINFYDDSAEE